MSSLISDVQKIVVSLSVTDVVVDTGSVAQLVVTMTNRQDTPDRLSLEVEGIDVEWYAIPVPAVNVAPGADVSARVLLRVARDSGSGAGSYPFLVRVQAMETGEVGVAQATLVVKPFSSLQVELDPKRSIATFFHPLNDFEVTVRNEGNAPETLDLYASDPDDGLAYEFDQDRITVKPGQTEIISVAMRPKSSSILGGSRLYGFTVTARSVDDSYVSANVHGQIEKYALISPILGIFLLLLGFGAGGYAYFRPRPVLPPVIHSFTVVPGHTVAGGKVTGSWDVDNAFEVIIKHAVIDVAGKPSETVNDTDAVQKSVGSVMLEPQAPETDYTFVVRGMGTQRDITRVVKVLVDPPPRPLSARITSFSAGPETVHAGDTVQLAWQAEHYKQAIIDPGNNVLSAFQKTMTDAPVQDKTYILRVIGDDNKEVDRKFSVHVAPKDVAISKVMSLTAKPDPVTIGDSVRLRWKTQYARSVHLSADNGSVNNDVEPNGSYDVKVEVPVTFTISAADSAGLQSTRQITVRPIAKPAPVVPLPFPDGGPGSGTPPAPGTPPGNPPPQ